MQRKKLIFWSTLSLFCRCTVNIRWKNLYIIWKFKLFCIYRYKFQRNRTINTALKHNFENPPWKSSLWHVVCQYQMYINKTCHVHFARWRVNNSKAKTIIKHKFLIRTYMYSQELSLSSEYRQALLVRKHKALSWKYFYYLFHLVME